MALKTPPLHAKGVYRLLTPWTISNTVIYECIAVRDFSDFVEKGENVYELFYEPKGLSEAVYNADKALGANIITLVSGSLPIIHVPDTYIEAYPDYDIVPYKSVVLSVALGPLPDSTDLTFLKTQVAALASDITGVVGQVNEHVLPSLDVVTRSQHTTLETGRQAAITNRKTDRARVIELEAIRTELLAKIATLEAIVIANGYVTPAP